jgi:hypothetical protein
MAWQLVWLEALHVLTVPPLQIPAAPAGPQPAHDWPVTSWLVEQVSEQAPLAVRQPPAPALHAATQHSFPAPTPQVVLPAVHVQLLHTSLEPLQYRVQVPG